VVIWDGIFTYTQRERHNQPTYTTVTCFDFSAGCFGMTLTSYLMEELQPPTRIPSVGPREGWVAASCPMQGAGGVTAVGVLRTLKNGRRCADGALGQESCYLGPPLRLEAVRCCRRGRVSDFPQSRTTRVSTVTYSEVTSFGAENPDLGSVRINGWPPV